MCLSKVKFLTLVNTIQAYVYCENTFSYLILYIFTKNVRELIKPREPPGIGNWPKWPGLDPGPWDAKMQMGPF